MSQQAFPVTFANLPGGNNPAALLDQNFAVCVRGPTPTVVGTVPYWDNTGGTSLNAGLPTNPGFGTIQTLVGLDSLNRLPAVSGALLTNIPSGLIRSYLAGMTMSNDGISPNTVLDISAGVAADSTNAVMINSPTAFTKSTGGAWTSGTGNNGMGLGLTIAKNTWYHTFAINNGGNPDFYFDTSAAGANAPVGTTAFRRIGSFKTASGTTNILAFTQFGDQFQWGTELNESGASGVTPTLAGVPLGVQTFWQGRALATCSSGGFTVDFISIGQTAGGAAGVLSAQAAGNSQAGGFVSVLTNTSQQIQAIATGNVTSILYNTAGWIDYRGRFN